MGLTDGDENAPAHGAAEASRQLEVVGTHGNAWHDLLGITDQGGPFDRFGEVAVLNQVALFDGEVELACRADTSAAHRLAVKAPIHRRDQIVW